MKKSIYVLLTIVTFITSAGFRGCGNSTNPYHLVLGVVIARHLPESDNTEMNYSIACGDDGIIVTSEGRPPAPWILRTSGTTKRINSVNILNSSDSSVAYAVGDSGTVLRSTDKGHTWSNRNVPYSGFPNLYALDFLPVQQGQFAHIVAAGDNGKVVKSENFGSYWNWFEYPSLTNRNFRSVVIINSSIWVIVGSMGAVYRTSTGGQNWQSISTGDTNSYNKIVQVRYDTYLIAGNNGKIFMSTNYGSSWTPRTSGTTKNLRDALFKNEFEGVVVGDDGTVRNTTNGGNTWTEDPYLNGLTTKDILSISQVDSVTVNSITRNLGTSDNAVNDTTFFHAVSSEPFLGIQPISNFIAEVFNLKQNYPNPFNPVTKIRFDIPANEKRHMSDVKIIIYDISGKEIDILVNESVRAGQYEVNWNAANHPCGVYFYTILADNHKETKKMVLVK